VREVIKNTLNNSPVKPSEISKIPIPGELDKAVMQCIEKDKEDRIQTVAELLRVLKQFT